jgi:hypothetical protein
LASLLDQAGAEPIVAGPEGAARVEPSAREGATGPERPAADDGPAFKTVLLLSRSEYQEANKNLLKEEGFWPLVWDTVDRLKDDIVRNADVCGFVVDQSILRDLGAVGQRALIESLAGYSTFAHIRVDERGLLLSSGEVRAVLKQARFMASSVPHEALSIQSDGNLRSGEIAEFRRASGLLMSHGGTHFVPGELSDDESRLLIAAVRSHALAAQFDGPVSIESLETRFLTGGSARIAVVRADRSRRPLVAKIAAKAAVLDEILRFRRFVQPLDDQLRPEVHFHGGAALILFALLPQADDRGQPADTLEARLTEMWNVQLFGSADERERGWSQEAASRALERVAQTLAELNRTSPGAAGFNAVGNPPVAYLERLEGTGFDWGLGQEALDARARAFARFQRLADRAVVHGDVHLRNVLLRGESDAHLIDYAACGPGHPAVDLVRLELSLYLQVSAGRAATRPRGTLRRVPASPFARRGHCDRTHRRGSRVR